MFSGEIFSYIYIYMCVCVYIYTHTHIYIYIYIHIYHNVAFIWKMSYEIFLYPTEEQFTKYNLKETDLGMAYFDTKMQCFLSAGLWHR
jgi:hypothetical protein